MLAEEPVNRCHRCPRSFPVRPAPLSSPHRPDTLTGTSAAFLNLPTDDVAVRVQAVAGTAAGPSWSGSARRCTVRRSAAETHRLRNRAWAALEGAGVVMTETAPSPALDAPTGLA